MAMPKCPKCSKNTTVKITEDKYDHISYNCDSCSLRWNEDKFTRPGKRFAFPMIFASKTKQKRNTITENMNPIRKMLENDKVERPESEENREVQIGKEILQSIGDLIGVHARNYDTIENIEKLAQELINLHSDTPKDSFKLKDMFKSMDPNSENEFDRGPSPDRSKQSGSAAMGEY